MHIILFLSNRNIFNKHKYTIYKTQKMIVFYILGVSLCDKSGVFIYNYFISN